MGLKLTNDQRADIYRAAARSIFSKKRRGMHRNFACKELRSLVYKWYEKWYLLESTLNLFPEFLLFKPMGVSRSVPWWQLTKEGSEQRIIALLLAADIAESNR